MGQCQFARRKILHQKLCSLEQDESFDYMIKLIISMLILSSLITTKPLLDCNIKMGVEDIFSTNVLSANIFCKNQYH